MMAVDMDRMYTISSPNECDLNNVPCSQVQMVCADAILDCPASLYIAWLHDCFFVVLMLVRWSYGVLEISAIDTIERYELYHVLFELPIL